MPVIRTLLLICWITKLNAQNSQWSTWTRFCQENSCFRERILFCGEEQGRVCRNNEIGDYFYFGSDSCGGTTCLNNVDELPLDPNVSQIHFSQQILTEYGLLFLASATLVYIHFFVFY